MKPTVRDAGEPGFFKEEHGASARFSIYDGNPDEPEHGHTLFGQRGDQVTLVSDRPYDGQEPLFQAHRKGEEILIYDGIGADGERLPRYKPELL